MNKIIFVNNNNLIETYLLNINKNKIIKIKKIIDNYFGKGKLLEKTTDVFSINEDPTLRGKKIEIISHTHVGKGKILSETEPNEKYLYNFKFYAYNPHQLSQLCEEIIKCSDSINLSYLINSLLNYSTETEFEKNIKTALLGTLEFQKITLEDILKYNITLKEKSNMLSIFKQILLQIKENDDKALLSITFEDEVNAKIKDLEMYNQGYRITNNSKLETFTEDEKKEIKTKIISSLPTNQLIKKRALIKD